MGIGVSYFLWRDELLGLARSALLYTPAAAAAGVLLLLFAVRSLHFSKHLAKAGFSPEGEGSLDSKALLPRFAAVFKLLGGGIFGWQLALAGVWVISVRKEGGTNHEWHKRLLFFVQRLSDKSKGQIGRHRESYLRDTLYFLEYLSNAGIDPLEADEQVIQGYVEHLHDLKRSPTTISRNLASVRCFYKFF